MARRKAPGKLKSLAELRTEKRLGTPGTITCVPFRADALNLFTGGGVKFGHVTEISGLPGMFKSTALAEVAGSALGMNAHVVIHDKERKLTEGRFTSLGIKNANRGNPRFWYHEDDFPDYILTLERMFEDMHEIWGAVRKDDLQVLESAFASGNASAAMCDRYAHLNAKPRPKTTDKKKLEAWQKKIAGNLKSPAQLDAEDRTPIVWIVDSVTAIPCAEEAIDPETGQPNLKPSIALNARVWSKMFQVCGFMDNRVAALHIAQIRTAGIGSGRGAYKKAAVASANEFYATNRIKFYPRESGQIYRDPNNPDNLLVGSSASGEQKLYQVGRVIMASIDKNLEGISTTVPLYMLAATGTDVINSMFEFLKMNGLIGGGAGGRYNWTAKFWPERVESTFSRAEFVNLYMDPDLRVELASKLRLLKEMIQYGSTPEQSPDERPSGAR